MFITSNLALITIESKTILLTESLQLLDINSYISLPALLLIS
jgi:hypothetical protein